MDDPNQQADMQWFKFCGRLHHFWPSLDGYLVLPGIVNLHSNRFKCNVALCKMKDMVEGDEAMKEMKEMVEGDG